MLKSFINSIKIRFNHFYSFFFCSFWQHEETGYICELPFWKIAGSRYYKIKMKE